jgi:vesicle-associated membrane protein 72
MHRPWLKEHIQYCINHPEEMSKLTKLKAQIIEVNDIIMDNIEKVLDRSEKIELLVDKIATLQFKYMIIVVSSLYQFHLNHSS